MNGHVGVGARTRVGHRAGVREWVGLAVLAVPTVVLGLDVSVLYLALPELAAALRPTGVQELWIMDAYGFLIAGFLITMGTLGDRIGRRRLLVIGAVAFGVVSVVAAYAPTAELLIAARAALGIAGATLMPSTLALIATLFADARQRAVAIGVWAMMFALGMAAGPLVGGVLLGHFWWGSAFLAAVPPLALLVVLAPVLLPEHHAAARGRLDLASVVLSLAAILPVVYAVKHGAREGLDPTTLVALVMGVGFAVVFVRRQRRLADPLLDVGLFANRAFSAALGLMLLVLVGVGGVLFLVTQQLQLVEGLTPFAAGLWMGPPALMMLLAALVTPVLAARFRPAYVVAGTLIASAVGYALLASVEGAGAVVPVVLGFGLVYLGLGAIAALGTDLVIGAAPADRSGSAAAMSETVQELGIAVGVAVLGSLSGAVYRARLDLSAVPDEVAPAVRDGLAVASEHADRIPDLVLADAKLAFTAGLNAVGLFGVLASVGLAALSVLVLRRVGPTGSATSDEESRLGREPDRCVETSG